MEVDEEPIYFRIVDEEFSSVEANNVEQKGEQVVIVLNYLDFCKNMPNRLSMRTILASRHSLSSSPYIHLHQYLAILFTSRRKVSKEKSILIIRGIKFLLILK